MSMSGLPPAADSPQGADPGPELDLSPYEGCWVALLRGQVVGVGRTADAALRAARCLRPNEKQEPLVIRVRHAPPPPV